MKMKFFSKTKKQSKKDIIDSLGLDRIDIHNLKKDELFMTIVDKIKNNSKKDKDGNMKELLHSYVNKFLETHVALKMNQETIEELTSDISKAQTRFDLLLTQHKRLESESNNMIDSLKTSLENSEEDNKQLITFNESLKSENESLLLKITDLTDKNKKLQYDIQDIRMGIEIKQTKVNTTINEVIKHLEDIIN